MLTRFWAGEARKLTESNRTPRKKRLLMRHKLRLPSIDDYSSRITQLEDRPQRKKNLLSGGRRNKPVVQIRPKPNPRLWRNSETGAMIRVKTCGETKAKSRELVNFAECHEAKKLSGIRMHRNSQTQLLQDDVS